MDTGRKRIAIKVPCLTELQAKEAAPSLLPPTQARACASTYFLFTYQGNSLKSFTSCFLAGPQASGQPTEIPERAAQKSFRTSSGKQKKPRSVGKLQVRQTYSFGKSLTVTHRKFRTIRNGIPWEHLQACCKNIAVQSNKDQSEPTWPLFPLQLFTVSTPSERCPASFHSLATAKRRHFLEGVDWNNNSKKHSFVYSANLVSYHKDLWWGFFSVIRISFWSPNHFNKETGLQSHNFMPIILLQLQSRSCNCFNNSVIFSLLIEDGGASKLEWPHMI